MVVVAVPALFAVVAASTAATAAVVAAVVVATVAVVTATAGAVADYTVLKKSHHSSFQCFNVKEVCKPVFRKKLVRFIKEINSNYLIKSSSFLRKKVSECLKH